MITTHNDNRFVKFANSLEFVQQYAEGCIEGVNFPEIICHILADFMDVGKKARHLTLQPVRIDTPELLAGSLDPLSMNVRWAEPVTKRRPLLSRVQEGLKVLFHFCEQGGLRLLRGLSSFDHTRGCLREPVEAMSC